MAKVDITVEVCGMAGDGTIAAGGLLNEALSGGGFSVLGFDSYPAEIRGFGRCVTRSRVGDREILALEDSTHVLISLDDMESRTRVPFLTEGASVFFDNNPPNYLAEGRSIAGHVDPGTRLLGLPIADLAAEASGSRRGRNLTALGAFAAVFGVPPRLFEDVIRKKFGPKGEKVVESNLKCFRAGHGYALEKFASHVQEVFVLPERAVEPEKVMMSGNMAIGKAALDAGLKLYFGYPITPATPIMEYLAKELPNRGGRVVQMEDEISSIGAVLGASYAGVRSMTATSGPGFALMTELLTHGVMAEIPAVVLDAQRGGPSTGLPTKTEQSDLSAAVFGGPGDSARIVIAPTNVAECYDYVVKSFQLAERYQTPVIVLTDFYLDNRVENLPVPHATEEEKAGGNLFPEESESAYKRYEVTDSGISPRAVPGMEGFRFVATGLEHTQFGRPDYTAEIHTVMTEKRYRKIYGALEELPPPVEYHGTDRMDVGVISWGSTVGSVLEAVDTARERGINAGALKITSLFPFHSDVIKAFMERCTRVLIPELNYEGQLANLLGCLSTTEVHRLNMVTGVPIAPSVILKRIEQLVQAGAR